MKAPRAAKKSGQAPLPYGPTGAAHSGARLHFLGALKWFLLFAAFVLLNPVRVEIVANEGPAEAADLIVHHAKVLTVDKDFRVAEALAVKGDKILAVGSDKEILRHKGGSTKVIDAGGKAVLPGLYDSHVHPVGAATSELTEPLPDLRSLDDVFAYIRKKAKETPEGDWIVLRYAFPTRLKEARFPTRAELDAAAPKHPVFYHAGPAGIVNSMALKISGVTRDTPNPEAGVVVKDPKTGEPTGMLRNAYGVLKGVPPAVTAKGSALRNAVKKLFELYNAKGITSVADRNADRAALDIYLDLFKAGDLTLRVNVARGINQHGTREEIISRLDALPGKDGLGGPTGRGTVWIRIGPIKFFLDGGMLNGTAYMRQPWPKGDTYQIVEDDYRGLLFTSPEEAKVLIEEATRRGWQTTAHTAGEGAMDVLLDAYEFVNRTQKIRDKRHCITHANFPSQRNLERCKELGVVADVQPVWLYKDGDTLQRVLGDKRLRWFQPYKSWLQYTVIGSGSDHMLKLDARSAVNPWDPWLGIWVAVTRKTESGNVINPDEKLTREEALRLYTVNNAYLHYEEKEKGSLEPGKLADFIMIDRDYLNCPVDDLLQTQVLWTVVGGKTVYERK
jgi:predicted amidohydrolase YtcJ